MIQSSYDSKIKLWYYEQYQKIYVAYELLYILKTFPASLSNNASMGYSEIDIFDILVK